MAVLDDSDKLAAEPALSEFSEDEESQDKSRRRWPWGPFGSAVLVLSLLIVFLLGSLFLSGPATSSSPAPSGLGTVLVSIQSCEPVSPGSSVCQERPLVGVEVDLHGADGAYSGLTDTAGTISFTVAPGDYTLAGQPQLGRADLHVPSSQGIRVDSFGHVSLILEYGH